MSDRTVRGSALTVCAAGWSFSFARERRTEMDEDRRKARERALEEAERGPTEEQKAKLRQDIFDSCARLQVLDAPHRERLRLIRVEKILIGCEVTFIAIVVLAFIAVVALGLL
jgi:hypothetical protein